MYMRRSDSTLVFSPLATSDSPSSVFKHPPF